MRSKRGGVGSELIAPLGFVLVIAVAGIVTAGYVSAIVLVAALVSVVAISVVNLRFGVLVLVGLLPLQGVIRWNDLHNVVGAVAVALLTAALLVTASLRLVARPTRLRISNRMLVSLFLFGIYLAILWINTLPGMFKQVVLGMFLVREYIAPFGLLILVYLVSEEEFDAAYVVVGVFFWSTVMVGAINLAHYFVGLGEGVPRWVTHPGSTVVEVRSLGIFQAPRLNHILGLSTQAAGAVYYVIGAFVGLELRKVNGVSLSYRSLLALGSGLLLLAGFLTLSGSFFVAILVILLFKAFQRLGADSSASVLAGKVLAMSLLVCGVGFLEFESSGITMTLWQYGYDAFIHPITAILSSFSLPDLLVGRGLGLKGGEWVLGELREIVPSEYLFDRWIFVTLLQVGFVGFSLMIAWWASLIVVTILMGREWGATRFAPLGAIIGIVLVGGLAFAHGAAPMERLFSPLFAICMGILLAPQGPEDNGLLMRGC